MKEPSTLSQTTAPANEPTANSRTVYQLRSEGDSLNGWKFVMRSKSIFATQEDAKRYIEEFEASCYDRKHFECAAPGSLKTEITELDFFE